MNWHAHGRELVRTPEFEECPSFDLASTSGVIRLETGYIIRSWEDEIMLKIHPSMDLKSPICSRSIASLILKPHVIGT